jgi:5-deoxy-glucuronate isomerase
MSVLREASPANVSWRFLMCRVHQLAAGETLELLSEHVESLLVLVEGQVQVTAEGIDETISRPSPFTDLAAVVYLPPRVPATLRALTASEVATGSAPAEGRFPARVVRPGDMTGEVRGGGNATRQVVTTFAAPIPAERLISYEAWVPRGSWTGWPPHRHDGRDGSPYLEETYYYRFDQPAGFGIHRNFDAARSYNELIPVEDRSLVPVPCGYHLCAAGPSSNAWILNFLAGTPDDRSLAPLFDPDEMWITEQWAGGDDRTNGALQLPAVHPGRS